MPATFPVSIKPVITRGYGWNTPDNVISIETMGGAPIQVRDYRTGPVTFSITVIGNSLIKAVMTDFIYGKISSGADKFYMSLDSGYGIEQHVCQIVPGSIAFDGSNGPVTVVSFTVRAETTPAQDNPYGGNLVDLYGVYGTEINALFDALDNFVNVELPVYF